MCVSIGQNWPETHLCENVEGEINVVQLRYGQGPPLFHSNGWIMEWRQHTGNQSVVRTVAVSVRIDTEGSRGDFVNQQSHGDKFIG